MQLVTVQSIQKSQPRGKQKEGLTGANTNVCCEHIILQGFPTVFELKRSHVLAEIEVQKNAGIKYTSKFGSVRHRSDPALSLLLQFFFLCSLTLVKCRFESFSKSENCGGQKFLENVFECQQIGVATIFFCALYNYTPLRCYFMGKGW